MGERFLQTNLTIHIAIGYLEKCYYLKLHRELGCEKQLRLLAIVCLIVASKYDELDDRIPFIQNV